MLLRGIAAIVAAALLVGCGGTTERGLAGDGTGDSRGSGGTQAEAVDDSGGSRDSAFSAAGRGDRADGGTAGADGEGVHAAAVGAAGATGALGDAGKSGSGGDISVAGTAGTAGRIPQETCRGPGALLCDGECVNVLTDSLHCGACGDECTGGQWCQDGTCTCGDMDWFCNGQCVDLMTSSLHCGVCDNACVAGNCVDGLCEYGPEGPSCAGGLECNGESCCTNLLVPGGTFPMGRCGAASVSCSDAYDGLASEIPEHTATISSFYLDKYEVTVGRFRAFVDAYDAGWRPSAGEGANAAVERAQGLSSGETGWQSAWDSELPTDGHETISGDRSLEDLITCDSSHDDDTWTTAAGANEQSPINCLSWYEAFAFCVWDGGRLPTESEWEYAAAGGDENRLFPWGTDATEPLPANYGANGNSPLIAVGSYSDGNGRWGHSDLAGSMFEWTLDWYAGDWHTTVEAGCTDCANLTRSSHRVLRGGNWSNPAIYLRAAYRFCFPPDDRHYTYFGLRCART